MEYQKCGSLLTRKEVIRVLLFSKENIIDSNEYWEIHKKTLSYQMKEVPHHLSVGCFNTKFLYSCN